MASDGQRIKFQNFNEETEYNAKLYKAIANPFTNYIDAVQFQDCPSIVNILTVEDAQRVKRKHDNEGQNAGARELISCLKTKVGWFDAVLEALDVNELKLKELRPRFIKERETVDREWQRAHPHTGGAPLRGSQQVSQPCAASAQVSLQSDSDADRVQPDPDSGMRVTSDFSLPPLVSNPSQEGAQADGAPGENDAPSSQAEVGEAAEARRTDDEQYVDATSTPADREGIYDQPQAAADSVYTSLTVTSLETDACPMAMQTSDVPEQEVGEVAQPHVRDPQHPQQAQQRVRQRPQSRQEHPSLSVAISNNPQKDFEAGFVASELSTLSGWSSHQDEHEVIQLIRPHRSRTGHYVLWYWALAKRPTICVVQDGRVVTFVIHKSASEPQRFYINRRQHRDISLRRLVEFHLANGIQHSPQGGETSTVLLSGALP